MSTRGLSMNEEDIGKLRTLLGLKGDAALSTEVEDVYWRIKQGADRLGCGMSDTLLILVAEQSGGVLPDKFNFLVAVDRGLVKKNAPILYKWRDGHEEGLFQAVVGRGRDRRVQVLMKSGEMRQLAPDDVKMKE